MTSINVGIISNYSYNRRMFQTNIGDDEVDIVIGELHADLTFFWNEMEMCL